MRLASVHVHNLAEVQGYLKQIPNRMFEKTKEAMAVAVFAADAKVKDNATNRLHVRTGALRRSIMTAVEGTDLNTLKASLFSGSPYGDKPLRYVPTHELGAVIKAKRAYKKVPGGPYLNIPTKENKTAAGVTRFPAREVFKMGGYVAGRSVWLDGKRMFSLVKSVRIPPRLGMLAAADEEVPTLLSALSAMVKDLD